MLLASKCPALIRFIAVEFSGLIIRRQTLRNGQTPCNVGSLFTAPDMITVHAGAHLCRRLAPRATIAKRVQSGRSAWMPTLLHSSYRLQFHSTKSGSISTELPKAVSLHVLGVTVALASITYMDRVCIAVTAIQRDPQLEQHGPYRM